MNVRALMIEVDAETADALEARAADRGISVSAVVTELVSCDPFDPDNDRMRREGTGPYSPEALAEDERQVAEFLETGEAIPWEDVSEWLRSWGTPDELPMPKARKL